MMYDYVQFLMFSMYDSILEAEGLVTKASRAGVKRGISDPERNS